MSDLTANLIEAWLKENPPPVDKSQPQSLAQLVQQNFFVLTKSGTVGLANLQAIAEGSRPTKADRMKVAQALGLPEQDVEAMYLRDFPDSTRAAATKD